MEFVINATELRAVLREIEAAEANGFMHCQAVFQLASAGRYLSQCVAVYSDLYERAHPTDARLNWGRGQGVTKLNKFVKGKLVRQGSGYWPEMPKNGGPDWTGFDG